MYSPSQQKRHRNKSQQYQTSVDNRLNSPLNNRRTSSSRQKRGNERNYQKTDNRDIQPNIDHIERNTNNIQKNSTRIEGRQLHQPSRNNLSQEIQEEEVENRVERSSSAIIVQEQLEAQRNYNNEKNRTGGPSSSRENQNNNEIIPEIPSGPQNSENSGNVRRKKTNHTSNSGNPWLAGKQQLKIRQERVQRKTAQDYFRSTGGAISGMEYLFNPQSQSQEENNSNSNNNSNNNNGNTINDNSNNNNNNATMSNIWEGITEKTKFIDLSLEQLGILSLFTETLDYVHKYLIVKYRQLYIKLLKSATFLNT
jgi:hypothetical protein